MNPENKHTRAPVFGTGWADNLCDLIGSKTGNLTQEISPPSIKRPAKKPSTYGLI